MAALLYHELHSYTEIRYVYQLPTEDFAQNFGIFFLLQEELPYVQTYFVMTSAYGRTDEFQVIKVYINFMIGLPGTIPSLHFYLSTR